MVRSEVISNSEKDLLLHISETFSHALNSFRSKNTIISNINRLFTGWIKWAVIASVTAVMFFPINMTALAPVEVVAKDPTVVTSPVNGVVKEVLIKTNENVKPGTELVRLDDLNFKNQYEIALQELEVAEAELLRIKQSSFTNTDDKARLVELSTEVG
jgi:Multidrug resistance efflux pump